MKTLTISLLFLLYIPWHAGAQPGFLDPSFGTSGTAFAPFISNYNYATDIALQTDGKILVTGYTEGLSVFRMFIVRYDTSGHPDPTFTPVISNLSPAGEISLDIAVQADGKIVIAGQTDNFPNYLLLIARYNSDGSPDSSFGNNGYVLSAVGSSATAAELAIQPDGKILVAGTTFQSSNDMLLMRFQSDGSIDSSFGQNGKALLDINNNPQEGIAMALQPDGKIVVAGSTASMQTAFDAVCARYLPNGLPDLNFGTNGVYISTQNTTDDDAAYGIALQPDGKIVLAGYTYTNFTYSDNLIIRLDSAGIPDNTFNGNGYVVHNGNSNDHAATNVLIQPDGKIVITGHRYNTNKDLMLARFNATGTIDTTFGNAGNVYTDIAQDLDQSTASVIQSDGKILLTGYYFDSGIENMVVTRYLPNATVSLNEVAAESGILIWPQPASELLNIGSAKSDSPEDLEFRIYSISGQLLMEIRPGKNPEIIPVNQLQSGMYILELKNRKTQTSSYKRFLKN